MRGAVFDLYVAVEKRRDELLEAHADLWDLDSSTQAQFLCSWNAFALQTLGDAFLQADYTADPKTVGFVPRVTERQVLALYSEVEPWVSREHQSQSNPEYRFDVMVPALLPPWWKSIRARTSILTRCSLRARRYASTRSWRSLTPNAARETDTGRISPSCVRGWPR